MDNTTLFDDLKIEEECRLHAHRMDFAAKADRIHRWLYDTKVAWIQHKS